MKPFSAGWEKLSPLERIALWFRQNKGCFKGKLQEYRLLMENFCITCTEPKLDDYFNYQRDIRFYPARHQEALRDGFFAAYNISPTLLALRSVEVFDPRMN